MISQRLAWCVALSMSSVALAELPTLNVPEVLKRPLTIEVKARPRDKAQPSFRLVFERPTRVLCFEPQVQGRAEVTLVFKCVDGQECESRPDNGSLTCLHEPALETPVSVVVGGPHRRDARLAFFDPDLIPDRLSWLVEGAPTALTAYPLLSRFPRPFVREDSQRDDTERLLLEAPLSLFRFLKFDLKPTDLETQPHGTEVSSWPRKGEPVLLYRAVDDQHVEVCAFDGLCLAVRQDFLSDKPLQPMSWPQGRRWVSTSYADQQDEVTGLIDRETLELKASRGNKLAAEALKAAGVFEACVEKTWKKLDPNYDAKNFVLVSSSGDMRGLDDVVGKKVHAACKGKDFEKKRAQAMKALRAGRAKDEKLALAQFQKRFEAWSGPRVPPAPPAGLGVGLRVNGQNAEVVELVAGGAGAAGGLAVGDLLVAANGESLEHLTVDQVLARLGGEPGTEVELELGRGGRLTVLKLRRTVAPGK